MFKYSLLICFATFAATTQSSAQIVALGASNTAGYG
ncbi:hypothetical protein OY671_013039, partial [Metschnikowia pulcherrima]